MVLVLKSNRWDSGASSTSSGLHHHKNRNLKLLNVGEDDEWKSGIRTVPQTALGESCRRFFRNHDALLKPLGPPRPQGFGCGRGGGGGGEGEDRA